MQQAAPPLTSVLLQSDSSKEEGQGFFLKGANGCFLVTAAHVLGDGADSVTFRLRGGTARKGTVRWAPPPGVSFDVGVIEASGPDTPMSCPELPTSEQVDNALSFGRGEVVLVDKGGDRFRIPVTIVRESPQIVARPNSADDQVQKGYSGGALTVNGMVVGVVSSVDNRGGQAEIRIERLDSTPSQARAYLSAPAAEVAAISGNMADAACGGKIIGATRGATVPMAGLNALLSEGNGDCMTADPGQGLEVEVSLCRGAESLPISVVAVARGSRFVGGGNFGSRPLVSVSAAGANGQPYRLVGSGRSFGGVKIETGTLRGVSKLKIQIPGTPRYQESLCSISVR
jgi:hypothetical protein